MKISLLYGLFFGEPAGIRTPDPRLRRPVLYPTELLTHLLNNNKYNSIKKVKCQVIPLKILKSIKKEY